MAGNNGIGDNLSPITNNTRDNLSPESLIQVIKQMQQYQHAYISKGASICKKSLNECKQQPCSISTKYEKTFSLSKVFSFIASVLDTGN